MACAENPNDHRMHHPAVDFEINLDNLDFKLRRLLRVSCNAGPLLEVVEACAFTTPLSGGLQAVDSVASSVSVLTRKGCHIYRR